MIILVDTSTSVARMTIVSEAEKRLVEWEANRELAKGMLAWMVDVLKANNERLKDVTGIGLFKGPGSFTGLRIGMTIANTLASSLDVPIVAEQGDGWQERCVDRLRNGENDKIALPLYDRDANITKPRK